MFCRKLSVKHTGPRSGRAVLQLHPEIDLLHRETSCASVQMPQRCPEVHWVILLGLV